MPSNPFHGGDTFFPVIARLLGIDVPVTYPQAESGAGRSVEAIPATLAADGSARPIVDGEGGGAARGDFMHYV
jgi:hypothetical protein